MCRQEQQFCKTCTGPYCNKQIEFQKCRVCNSADNINCIRSPESFEERTCRKYIDECFTHVENNVVIRGCVSNMNPIPIQNDCNANNEYCEKCSSGFNCNNKIIDGEFCLTCNSENDPNCRENLNNTMRTQCPLSVNQRGCYRYDDGGNIYATLLYSTKLNFYYFLCF